jgi:mRNA-degrading endonuclease RelE of RelBE toxin-antitoxin system
MFELEKTPNYRFQYNKLSLKLQRMVNDALEIIKETPTEFQGKIMHLAKRKDFLNLYRFRIPGAYIHYLVHEDEPIVTLTSIKIMH